MFSLRRISIVFVLAACALPAGKADAVVRTFPGCGATLEACINSSASGTTIRLRTNALIAIPDSLAINKSLSLVAAPGFKPKIGRTNPVASISFNPSGNDTTVVVRGIEFRQTGVETDYSAGTGHRVIYENNRVTTMGGGTGASGLSAWFSGTSRGSLTIRNNVISSSGYGLHLRAQGGPATITGNRIEAPDGEQAVGFNVGAGTVRALVANNVINGAGGCNCGSPAGLSIAAYLGGVLQLRLLNNTVTKASKTAAAPGILVIAYDPGTVDAWLYNNMVSNSGSGIQLYSSPELTAHGDRNNTFDVPGGDSIGSYDLGTMLHRAPGFVNAGAGDFRLRKTSPLRNAGRTCINSQPLPRADAAGKFRLVGAAVDIGAYEQGSTIGGGVRGRNASGTNAAKRMNGTSGIDVLCGLGGADRLYGLGGGDFLFGGAGNDRAFGGNGADLIDVRDGTRGNDRAFGGPGRDMCLRDPSDLRRDCP